MCTEEYLWLLSRYALPAVNHDIVGDDDQLPPHADNWPCTLTAHHLSGHPSSAINATTAARCSLIPSSSLHGANRAFPSPGPTNLCPQSHQPIS